MSSAKKLNLYEYDKQIAGAFKVDCEEFLEEFEKLKSLRFTDFTRVWQLKNFTFVFAGQKYALLLKELCENYFYIVKKFIMSSGSIFTQLGGIYLLYGLYYKQPLRHWVKIRLTLEEYKKITELIEEVKRRGQYEAVYVFAKMKVDQAFIYTALQRPLGPEDRFVKSYESYLDYAFSCSKNQDTFMKFNEIVQDGDLVKDIEKTNDEYQELMKKYAEKCPSLTPFTSNIVKVLQEAHSTLDKAESSSKYEVPSPELSKTEKSQKSVKAKAMTNKHAVYRGKRKVKTAIDIDFGDSLLDDDNFSE
ncbi:snRNA-activating protein complex subunit 1 [Anoplophora glabripennis]|uniref:snRNA-activating protein complex subunit 1 n=1 Tax=Anoplophora glabripennis TaxID=217634 RepID=UPI0008753AE4|nr:snRNA-activating protein complex subunit 1 [Anoplophora glabripennis]